MPSKNPKANPLAPLISVIVPAYNTEQTITESIDSVLAQTFKDYEIVVVDDGSPDNVAEVVKKKYGQKVRLLRQENRGLAGARNTGIRHAKGTYVAFLDSDDVWLPNKLAKQIDHITEHPDGDVFYTNCYFWQTGKKTGQWTDVHRQKNGRIFLDLVARTVMLPVLTVVAKKQAVIDAGLFDESLRQVEDYDLWLRMGLRGCSFYGLPQPLALYRINPEGLSQNVLLMAQTQLGVYRKLLQSTDRKFQPEIKVQIKIFEREVLHQKRKLAIQNHHHLDAAWLTLAMIPGEPLKTPVYLVIALLLVIAPPTLSGRLS